VKSPQIQEERAAEHPGSDRRVYVDVKIVIALRKYR
jgi:hypothetical protein